MNLFDYITIIPNLIPEDHINELMSLTNQESSYATAGSNEQGVNIKDRNTLWFPIPPKTIENLNHAISTTYRNLLYSKYRRAIKNIEPTQLLGYPVGGHYIEHNDSETLVNGKWERIMQRDISLLFYLNDDYTGGELEFTTLGLTIRPKRGMMIAFPSYKEFPHKVHPVLSGNRYNLVSWIETEERVYV